MNLIWLEPALEQLETILDYIAARDEGAAWRLQLAIEACAERLPEHPFLYRPGRVEGAREAVVHPNYIIVYRVTTNAVEIDGASGKLDLKSLEATDLPFGTLKAA